MVCRRCGFKIYEKVDYCPSCRHPVYKETGYTVPGAAGNRETVRYIPREEEPRQIDFEIDKPVSAVLVTTTEKTKTKKSVFGAATRMAIGGVAAGPVGALVGLATTGSKNKITGQTATFSVTYASGKTKIETVKVGSKRFKTLAALL